MNKDKASDFFHKEDKLNCAQAVLKFCESHESISPEIISEFQACGGGRAPEGVCGALHAIKFIFDDPEKHLEFEKEFIAVAGSTTCREIRRGGKLSCAACVDLAGSFAK
jgi:hypothetical protein